MKEQAKFWLEQIGELQGAEELADLCNEIYKNADEIIADGQLDEFLKQNYIFATDIDGLFITATEWFRSFLMAVFDLADKELYPGGKWMEEHRSSDLIVRMKIAKQPYINGYVFRICEGLGKPWNMFCALDLTSEGQFLETEDMNQVLNNYVTIFNWEVFFFRVRCSPEEAEVAEEVIGKVCPVKLIRFRDSAYFPETHRMFTHEVPANAGTEANGAERELSFEAMLRGDSFQALAAKYQSLNDGLKKVVVAQDGAVNEIVQGLFSSELDNEREKRKRPKAMFLLMGSPGVGKTLLARTAGRLLTLPTLILNMSDYAEEKSYIDLVGTSKRFRNGSEGKLVRFVRENPQGIVVFDEIEKAHLTTIHLLLQILDMGVLLNAYTEEYVDFSDTILFFTTNAGRSIYEDERNRELSGLPKKTLVSALSTEKNPRTGEPYFPQAICSRLMAGNIMMLNRIDTNTLLTIVRSAIQKEAEKLRDAYRIDIKVSDEVFPLFLYQQGNQIDARVASQKSVDFIKKEMYEISRLMRDTPDLFEDVRTLSFEVDAQGNWLELLHPKVEGAQILCVGNPVYGDFPDADVKLLYVNRMDELAEALKKDYVYLLVDPYLGYHYDQEEPLCLNDMQSEGMRMFHELIMREIGLPIYMLDVDGRFTQTDRESLALDGADGCVVAGDSREDFICTVCEIARKHTIARQHEDFCSRGYSLDFTSRQIKDGDTLRIQFYGLRKLMVPDAESAKMIVGETEKPKVKFNDVIGAQDAKEELKFFAQYLKEPKKALLMGNRPPKGILLYGEPGTGKTMLAKALAGECDAAFISIGASDLLRPHLGQSEALVRRIFATARRYSPAILFIDEIDAIGKLRTGEGNTSGVESILNTLLTEMDGFQTDSKKPVIVLAATNFYAKAYHAKQARLDPALLRRFDRQIYVDLPTEAERTLYLSACRDRYANAEISDEAIRNLAKRSVGKSIANLENIVQLALRNAMRTNSQITDELLLDAYEQEQFGLKQEYGEQYYWMTAVHEAGHAYMAHIAGSTPEYITVTGRADFAGYVAFAADEKKTFLTEKEYRWKIRELLAGRMAEIVLVGGDASLNTGAAADMTSATQRAIEMVLRYGFVEDQMLSFSGDFPDQNNIPQEYLQLANRILLEERAECEKRVTDGKDRILKLAHAVLARNYLTSEQIREVLEG